MTLFSRLTPALRRLVVALPALILLPLRSLLAQTPASGDGGIMAAVTLALA